jgi:hypothetical protein
MTTPPLGFWSSQVSGLLNCDIDPFVSKHSQVSFD